MAKLKDIPEKKGRLRSTGQTIRARQVLEPSLLESYPDVAVEIVYGNGRTGTDAGPSCGVLMNFKCDICQTSFDSTPRERTQAIDRGCPSRGCPGCGHKKGKGTKVALPEQIRNELVAFVLKKGKRRVPSGFINAKSPALAQFRCSTCMHEYNTKICVRTKRGQHCPDCYIRHNTSEAVDLTRYAASKPSSTNSRTFFDLYDRTARNTGFRADCLPPDHRVFWRHDNHSWYASFNETVAWGGCPHLSHYDIEDDYDPALNFRLKLSGLKAWNKEHQITWRCRHDASHMWQDTVYGRTIAGYGCPHCTGGRKPQPGSLAEAAPRAASDVVCDDSGAIDPIDPGRIKMGSHKKYLFRCGLGHEQWQSPRQRAEQGCKKCRLELEGFFVKHHEQALLIQSFEDEKTTKFNVKEKSRKRAVFKCPYGHPPSEARIDNKARGQGCPYCKSRKVCFQNSLAGVYPHLAALYHSSNPRAADKILARSKDKCTWLCDGCGETFDRKVYDMVHRGPGCNSCRKKARAKRKAELLRPECTVAADPQLALAEEDSAWPLSSVEADPERKALEMFATLAPPQATAVKAFTGLHEHGRVSASKDRSIALRNALMKRLTKRHTAGTLMKFVKTMPTGHRYVIQARKNIKILFETGR